MIRVYTATREEHLATALNPRIGLYDKTLVPKSRCPDNIYVYTGTFPGGEIDGSIVQAALFDFMAGYRMVVLSGLIPESQLRPGPNADLVIGLQLTVDKILALQLNQDQWVQDVTDKFLKTA